MAPLGVILCGGQSLRMGQDKGLLQRDGLPWVKLISNNFEKNEVDYVVSIRPDQFDDYGQFFEKEKFVFDGEFEDINGGLIGLLSVHLKSPDKDLFVVPCDLPDVSVDFFRFMLEQFEKGKAATIIPRSDGYIHPLSAIYSSLDLQKLLRLYKEGALFYRSVKSIIIELESEIVTLPESIHGCLKNFNSPADLAKP